MIFNSEKLNKIVNFWLLESSNYYDKFQRKMFLIIKKVLNGTKSGIKRSKNTFK